MKHFLLLTFSLLIIIVTSCSKETDLRHVIKTVSNGLSEKQKYYLNDQTKLTQRTVNRKALIVTIYSSDPTRNRTYIDCSTSGSTCDVSAKSLAGSKARIMNWLDSQVPNVTSQMLEDSIVTDTSWTSYFPELFYTNINNAISHDTLRLTYNGVDLSVIDNYTEELIYNHKWTDPWSFSGGTWKKTNDDPNHLHFPIKCPDAGSNCLTSVSFTKYTNMIGLFHEAYSGTDFAYYVENDLYACSEDSIGGFRFVVCPSTTCDTFCIIHNAE